MITRFIIGWVLASSAAALAAEAPFGVLDITLGAGYVRLQRDLDFRDINTALARMQ